MRYSPRTSAGNQSRDIVMNNKIVKIDSTRLSDSFNSDSPSVFVGRVGYPHVNVGLLTPPEKQNDTWLYDAPRAWGKSNFAIPKVVDYRSALINSRFKANIKDSNRMIDIAKEVSQSMRPVDLEVNLEKKPKIGTTFDQYVAPTGPNANAKHLKITSNTKINKQVEKRVSDTDLLSNQAIVELFDKGYDENFLSKLLSVGNLGIGKNRKLVPTRWSITAVDDNIGKDFIDGIKDYENMEYSLFFGGYLGNYYLTMMFEDVWEYELFEMFVKGNGELEQNEWSKQGLEFATDYEGYDGRKGYAEETAGGYYAARLPILQFLSREKRQASCLVLRFITGEYTTPLGVWVVREASRKSVEGKRHIFETKEKMIDYARFIVRKKFGVDLNKILKESKLYEMQRKQMKLTNFVR